MAFDILHTFFRDEPTTFDFPSVHEMVALQCGTMLQRLVGDVSSALNGRQTGLEAGLSALVLDLFFLEHLVAECGVWPIESGLCRKYGTLCVDCGKTVCICPLPRKDRRWARLEIPSSTEALPVALSTLAEWQMHLRAMYPNPHLAEEHIFARLFGEMGELIAVLGDRMAGRHKKELALEFADVVAWLCALATHRDVFLDEQRVLTFAPSWTENLLIEIASAV